jgi:hypothetical protein
MPGDVLSILYAHRDLFSTVNHGAIITSSIPPSVVVENGAQRGLSQPFAH